MLADEENLFLFVLLYSGYMLRAEDLHWIVSEARGLPLMAYLDFFLTYRNMWSYVCVYFINGMD